MSKGPENRFIESVHRLLPDTVYRMKNHNEYTGGIADCWYDGPRGDLWVEYKFIEVPKRDGTIIDLIGGRIPMLSKLQQTWLHGRFQNGRNVAVIVGCKEGGVWFSSGNWITAHTAGEFRQWLHPRQALAKRIQEITCG